MPPACPVECHARCYIHDAPLIPLSNWFDLNTPDDYSILVVLPSNKKGSPPWVAGPVKLRVRKPTGDNGKRLPDTPQKNGVT